MLAMYKKKEKSSSAVGRYRKPISPPFSYLVSGVLFIMALRGLSSPASSRAGNRNGMIGMALAIVTTLWVAGVTDPVTWGMIVGGLAIGGGIGALTARRIAMTDMPQLVAAFHSLVGLAAVLVAGAAFYSPDAFGIAAGRRDPHAEPDRNEPRRRHRRHHLRRLHHRVRQAQRQYERRADHPARAPRAQHSDLRGHRGADRLFRDGAGAMDILGHRGAQLRLRHHAHHSHRRRGYAGRRVDAQFLFGMGGGRRSASRWKTPRSSSPARWSVRRARSSPTSCARG